MAINLHRINDNMEKRQVRRLKNLVVRETSLVDVAANPHAKVMMWKRLDQEKPSLDITKALGMWNCYVDLVATRDKVLKSVAIDRASKEMPELLEMAKMISGAGTVLKLGDDGIAPAKTNPPEHMDSGNRVVSRTRDAPHGVGHPQPFSPYDYTSAAETGEQALARYRGLYSGAREQGMLRDARNYALGQMDKSDAAKLSASDLLNEENKTADNLVSEAYGYERDANRLRHSPGKDGGRSPLNVPSNGSGQRGLGVTSNPNRAM
jgi:hypothetical protein